MSIALRSGISSLGALIMLLATNFKLSLIVLLSIPLILLPILYFGRRVRTLSRQSQDSIASVGSYAGEVIQQIKIVQSFTQESFEKAAFGEEVERAFSVAKAYWAASYSHRHGYPCYLRCAECNALVWWSRRYVWRHVWG